MGQDDPAIWPPSPSPLYSSSSNNNNHNSLRQEDDGWRHFDSSVNALSFGFVATAVLISMFLVMAILEKLLRPPLSPSPDRSTRHSPRPASDPESQTAFHRKLSHPSPKMSVYAKGVSVLMPGEDIPTYIAHPTPMPCPPERTRRPLHPHGVLPNSSTNPNLSPMMAS